VIPDFFGVHSKITRTGRFAHHYFIMRIVVPKFAPEKIIKFIYFFYRFLRSGVYLVLEKIELQVYQRLVKKM
jgi:hypothetical protein